MWSLIQSNKTNLFYASLFTDGSYLRMTDQESTNAFLPLDVSNFIYCPHIFFHSRKITKTLNFSRFSPDRL